MADGPVRRGRKPVISREQVLDAAADALAEGGAESVSLRAIARSLGVVSSAIYRHFRSRDALLAELIASASASLREAVALAETSVPRADTAERFAVIVRSTRAWAKQDPHRYALLYGTPALDHRADGESVPTVRMLIAEAIADATASAHGSATAHDALALDSEKVVAAWTQLFGHVSFELFGRYDGVIDDVDGYTEALIVDIVRRLGLSRPSGRSVG